MADDKWIDIGKNTVDTSKGYTINFDKVFNREDIANMDMYQSPITTMFDDIEYKMREEHEKQIFEAIQNVEIRVDKEELIKALQYDRDQYRKGYNDAMEKVRVAGCKASDKCVFDCTDGALTDNFERTYNKAIERYTHYFWEFLGEE